MTARSSTNSSASELLLISTSKSGDELSSLMEYVDRMKEGQNDIYCITGESIAVIISILGKCAEEGFRGTSHGWSL